jgi:hypothetical protein
MLFPILWFCNNMNNKKLKAVWNPDILKEAQTLGYMEGFSDGRNEVIDQLVKYKLLKKNWKAEYNKQYKDDGYMSN